MTKPNDNRRDSLSLEVEAALEGINLQDLDESGRAPAARGSKGAAGPRPGERLVKGTVVGVSGDDVIVELGPLAQGVIKRLEFDEPPAVGAVFEFSLHGMEDGLHVLSRKEAKSLAAWNDLAVGARVEARVTGQNTGGLELRIGPIAAFMPASQVGLGREDNLAQYLNRNLECQVLEIDPGKKRVLVSRRAVLETEREAARKDAVGTLTPGQVVQGKVTRVEPFGAFVDIGGGVEGLLHVSNISRKRVENATEAVKKNDVVRVMILDIKEGGKRIGLGMKQLEADPWDDVSSRVAAGQTVSGKIVRLTEFGAFVELLPGVEGLLHVSQMSKERVRRPQDAVQLGQTITVRVQNVDSKQRRVSLTRFDERGALIGSEDSVESGLIDEMLQRNTGSKASTNLGSLFKKALGDKKS
jgi:small subunit ribosomal protein S1